MYGDADLLVDVRPVAVGDLDSEGFLRGLTGTQCMCGTCARPESPLTAVGINEEIPIGTLAGSIGGNAGQYLVSQGITAIHVGTDQGAASHDRGRKTIGDIAGEGRGTGDRRGIVGAGDIDH